MLLAFKVPGTLSSFASVAITALVCVDGNFSVLGGLTFHLCSSWVEYWFFLFGMVLEAFDVGELQPDVGRQTARAQSS